MRKMPFPWLRAVGFIIQMFGFPEFSPFLNSSENSVNSMGRWKVSGKKLYLTYRDIYSAASLERPSFSRFRRYFLIFLLRLSLRQILVVRGVLRSMCGNDWASDHASPDDWHRNCPVPPSQPKKCRKCPRRAYSLAFWRPPTHTSPLASCTWDPCFNQCLLPVGDVIRIQIGKQ